jgi:hypothetical protein
MRLTLGDLSGLVLGYSLAALVWRALWPPAAQPAWWSVALGSACFLWLGLAMSGPILLLIRPGQAQHAAGPDPDHRETLSRAEHAWLLLGAYWIGLAGAAWSLRLRVPLGMGAIPLLLVGLLWWRQRVEGTLQERRWTRPAARILLLSWPPVWVAMIILARALENG